MINNVIDLVYEDNVINKSVVYCICILCIRDYGGVIFGVGFLFGYILFLDINLWNGIISYFYYFCFGKI